MNLLDRYIRQAVLTGTMLVLGVLLALFSFISFIGEMDSVGQAHYGVLQAAGYIALMLPRLAYQLFPMAALLGSLIGLGMLATHNELIVMRATGISLQRIIGSVLKAALVLVVIMILLSEYVAPHSETYARDMRSRALTENTTQRTREGFWTRNGNNFINVRTVLSKGVLGNVHIYEFDESQHLRRLTHARSAMYRDHTWVLTNVVRTEFLNGRVKTLHRSRMTWETLLNPQLLDVIEVKPQSLSGWGLYQYARYLRSNELDAEDYEVELWNKIMLPFACAVMVILAVPFVFGSLRSVGVGQRIMLGSLIGIAFYLLDQVFTQVGMANDWNPVLSASTPTALFFLLALYMLRRVL